MTVIAERSGVAAEPLGRTDVAVLTDATSVKCCQNHEGPNHEGPNHQDPTNDGRSSPGSAPLEGETLSHETTLSSVDLPVRKAPPSYSKGRSSSSKGSAHLSRIRYMGDGPTRVPRESQQEVLPTTIADSHGSRSVSESWHEIAAHFEESVSKPSQQHHTRPGAFLEGGSGYDVTKDSSTQRSDPLPQRHSIEDPESQSAEKMYRSTSGRSLTSEPPRELASGGKGNARPLSESFEMQEEKDLRFVDRFWTIYDDIIILSLFTQLGVLARLLASTWFTFFDGVFRADSPLFTNLPLNCLSCFLLGLLGSGDRLMEMITTRFTPRNLQQRILDEEDTAHGSEGESSSPRSESDIEAYPSLEEVSSSIGDQRRRRRQKSAKDIRFHSWEPPVHLHDDLREVQLLALERRIRTSKCLVLFPVMKEDADVLEHYFEEGFKASVQTKKHQFQSLQRQRRQPRQRHGHLCGRQKFCSTKIADSENCRDGSRRSYVAECDGDVCLELRGLKESVNNDEDIGCEDGRFRFDLRLTESAQRLSAQYPVPSCIMHRGASASGTTSTPETVQKLIKRAPGVSTIASSVSASTTPGGDPIEIAVQQPHFQQSEMELTESDQLTEEIMPGHPRSSHQTTAGDPAVSPVFDDRVTVEFGTERSLCGSMDRSLGNASGEEGEDAQLEHIFLNVQANFSESISRIRRVNLANGWDVGTTPEAMADDLMLGLRDGFCGALSSFSSWNSSMLNLLREGHIGEAVVGYLLGIHLPIVAYRFGQQIAVYFFVWRCRRETRQEERKGWYGIRVRMDDEDGENSSVAHSRKGLERNKSSPNSKIGGYENEQSQSAEARLEEEAVSRETPSVRAVCTALYLLALVTQCTSLSFFSEPEDQQAALSLLFSPVGSLTRWRLSRLNCWRPGFPLGTFACNILACALGGSLGSLLAGNPGPRERILLQSLIAGFGGTLSSLATFIVEILAGMDPLLFRFDGVIYAVCSIGWALIVGFVFSASVDWADETT